jgi:hypothetical protein
VEVQKVTFSTKVTRLNEESCFFIFQPKSRDLVKRLDFSLSHLTSVEKSHLTSVEKIM